MVSKKDMDHWRKIVIGFLIGIMSWAFLNLVHSSIQEYLVKKGIETLPGQYAVIIIGVAIILFFLIVVWKWVLKK